MVEQDAVEALLAETGRTEADLLGRVAAIREATAVEEKAQADAEAAWHAELDKPKGERDGVKVLRLAVAAGIYVGDAAEQALAKADLATDGETATDGSSTATDGTATDGSGATAGATDGPGESSLLSLAREIDNGGTR